MKSNSILSRELWLGLGFISLVLVGCNRPYLLYDPSSSEREHLSLAQIVELSQANVADEIIIAKVKETNSYYHLTRRHLKYLRENRVSERVIRFLKTRKMPERRRYSRSTSSYDVYYYHYDYPFYSFYDYGYHFYSPHHFHWGHYRGGGCSSYGH
ncbi:MAG: hypothetical protein D6805_02640 [Planctomycetota bacterium]|nr:MAG: hypothetical protein D6805_02640 [Planctomycetota bacterium]